MKNGADWTNESNRKDKEGKVKGRLGVLEVSMRGRKRKIKTSPTPPKDGLRPCYRRPIEKQYIKWTEETLTQCRRN
ncbi:MAG TPA: hypothetical protein DIW30_03615 [Bacteroidales bacterium]|nr:hypothetical protein [Bacteroidales bacterium]